MLREFWAPLALLLGGLASFVGLCAFGPDNHAHGQGKKSDKAAPGAGVFGLDRVWTFHLNLTAEEYQAMQPKAPPLFGGFGKPAEPTDSDRNVFGTEFPWVVGDFTADGQRHGPAGFRYKGNSTFAAAARRLKRSIKIELDHYDEDARFHGMKTLNLNCAVLDPSRVREALAMWVYRQVGVPASRTAFAEVSVTVPGKYEAEYLGFYTMIEHVDRTFLKDRLKNNKGLLLKPERMRDLDYLGEEWERYRRFYQPKQEPTLAQARRLIEFVRLVNRGSDEQFRKEIADYLDIDAFLKFLAGTALVSSMDSFFALGHNYYLYLHPDTNRFQFIPWDLDLAFGNFVMMATQEQQFNLSLKHPYPGKNRLTDRLMALPEIDAKYQALLKDLAGNVFTREKLLAALATVERVSKDPVRREIEASTRRKESPTTGPGESVFGKPAEIRTFIEKRLLSVEAQVAGRSKGVIPKHGFPWGGGPDVIPGEPAPPAKP